MNLIRNGGFESGDLTYWNVLSAGVLEYDDVDEYLGDGCGKFTASGAATEQIVNQDYIEVNPYNTVLLSAYIKSAAARNVRMYVFEYDDDLTWLGERFVSELTSAVGYSKVQSLYIASKGVSYVRIALYIRNALADEVFYIDEVELNRIVLSDLCYEAITLKSRSVIAASGSTSGDQKDMKAFNTFYGDLEVYAVTGTNPTLDVVIYEMNTLGVRVVVGTFAQKTATGGERVALVNSGGNLLYTGYVLGGTTPTFDFAVGVAGKR